MAARETRQDSGTMALRELRRALLRASVIFGSLALVFVMAITNGFEHRSARMAEAGIDEMMTGSIDTGAERYTVSRSVLQAPGAGPCLYFPDGSRRGAC
ncbi:hypothetical protein [Aureimonas mangrovi]|uniref:hypothetical protein n=1 Tax=Aureimonas mangrovi TaxID=2758041 RepID=UPI00163DE38A|nr:hypothetical protein [Aureimonas mangrovi]